jgi:hypothetical protein
MPHFMVNCKQYAELSSKSLDGKLSMWEQVAFKLHQMVCPPCSEVVDQFQSIRDACRWAPHDDDPDGEYQCDLPDSVREHLKAALKDIH